MKALTIRQPWVWAILHAGKRIENRSRKTNYRGLILIHAGLAKPTVEMTRDAETRANGPVVEGRLPYGLIVATAVLDDCVWSDVDVGPWGEPNSWHWMLRNVKPLKGPIAARGQLGLWNFR